MLTILPSGFPPSEAKICSNCTTLQTKSQRAVLRSLENTYRPLVQVVRSDFPAHFHAGWCASPLTVS